MRTLLLRAGLLALAVCLPMTALAQLPKTLNDLNLLSDGGFEASAPSYWTASGAGATWTSEVSRTPSFSLKLSGAGAASWTMSEAVRNWTPRFPANAELEFGAWVWTDGVNTNPANDDARFQLVMEFFNTAGGTNLLGQPVVLDIPQTAATTGGWVQVSTATLGVIQFPADAQSARITVRKGASATGTVYVDDFFIRTATANVWTGDLFNANVDVPGGWYYWWDGFSSGSPNWPAQQPFQMSVSTTEANSGSRSLRIRQNVADASETVAISQRVPAREGEPMLVSFWVKTEGNEAPDQIGTGDNNIGLTALWYSNMASGAAGYNELGGVDIRLNGEYNPQVIPLHPQQAASGWRQYAFIVYPREGTAGMELRLRYWHAWTGTTYWDDVVIAPVSAVLQHLPNLLSDGGFEATSPSYWTPSGDGAVWSSERSRTPNYSLRVGGAGASSWTMNEAIRNWTPRFPGNAELEFGAWVWTNGVNTNPSSDAERFQIVYEFFDRAGGTNVLGQPVVLDLPQTAATTGGWVRVSTSSLGVIQFPGDATSARITVRKGANATGEVFVDDFFISTATANVWTGDIFNANVDVPGGWYYWWDGFTSGAQDWPANQPMTHTVSTANAFSGSRSLLLRRAGPTVTSETVAISQRVPVTQGQPVLVSFMLRTTDVANPDQIGTGDNNVGVTALWYSSLESGAAGYNEMGGADIRLNGEYNPQVFPIHSRVQNSEWMRYGFVFNPREGAAGMEVRLRYWHAFQGAAWWDDVAIVNLGAGALSTSTEEEIVPGTGSSAMLLLPNYPNPFRTSTQVGFVLPQAANVTLEVYNLLGQRVATLAHDQFHPAGTHMAEFDATNVPAGVYLYVLRAGDHVEARQMMVVK